MMQKNRKKIFNRNEPVLSETNNIEKRKMNTAPTMMKYSAGEVCFLKRWTTLTDKNMKESKKNPIARYP